MSVFGPLENETITVAPLDNVGQGGGLSFGTRQTVDVRLRDVTEAEVSIEEDTLNVGVKLTTSNYEFTGNEGIWLPGANTSDPADAYQTVETGDDSTLNLTLSYALL